MPHTFMHRPISPTHAQIQTHTHTCTTHAPDSLNYQFKKNELFRWESLVYYYWNWLVRCHCVATAGGKVLCQKMTEIPTVIDPDYYSYLLLFLNGSGIWNLTNVCAMGPLFFIHRASAMNRPTFCLLWFLYWSGKNLYKSLAHFKLS